jgi:hypothetical protein
MDGLQSVSAVDIPVVKIKFLLSALAISPFVAFMAGQPGNPKQVGMNHG